MKRFRGALLKALIGMVGALLSGSLVSCDLFGCPAVPALCGTPEASEPPDITVSPTSGLMTTEAGATDSFTVVLDSEPAADVTIGLSSSDLTEGTVSLTSLSFTSLSWSTAQTVTVTGVDDAIADGNQSYTIVIAPINSTDVSYNGLNPEDVSASNSDNDSPGITVSPAGGLVTSESGATDSFTVVLDLSFL